VFEIYLFVCVFLSFVYVAPLRGAEPSYISSTNILSLQNNATIIYFRTSILLY